MDSRIDHVPSTPPVAGALQRVRNDRSKREREEFQRALEEGEGPSNESIETVQPLRRKIRRFGMREPEEGGTQLDVVG